MKTDIKQLNNSAPPNSEIYASYLFRRYYNKISTNTQLVAWCNAILLKIENIDLLGLILRTNHYIQESVRIFKEKLGRSMENMHFYYEEQRHQYQKNAEYLLKNGSPLWETEKELLKLAGATENDLLKMEELNDTEIALLTLVMNYQPSPELFSDNRISEVSTSTLTP